MSRLVIRAERDSAKSRGGVPSSGDDRMITRRIPLDRIDEAFEEMKTGEVARSVVVFD